MATSNNTPGNPLDLINALQSKAAQLEAIMNMTFGEAAESFNNLSDQLRDNYLWHASEMVGEIRTLAESLTPAAVVAKR